MGGGGCKVVEKGTADPVKNQSKLKQEDREVSAKKKKKKYIFITM